MKIRIFLATAASLALFAAGYWSGAHEQIVHADPLARVYELRVYHANPGKLNDLLARFRDHTMTIFERHHMHNVAYWTPTDEPLKGQTLYYIISHDSRAAATKNWDAFRADPEWQQVSKASEANGKLVEKVDSTFLEPTDFSPMK